MTEVFSPLTLPSDYIEMENFIVKDKVKLTEQIVTSVYYALDNNLNSIEVFNFKDSDFIVDLEYSTFKDNVDNIFEYYLKTERYEFCNRVKKLKLLLEQHEQKKRYKPKGLSKHKNKGND